MADFLDINFNFSQKNLSPFFDKGNKGTDELNKAIAQSVIKIHEIAVKKLSEHGTGRVYKKKGGILHQASSPGKPPASDTGNLKSNTGFDYAYLVGHIVSNTGYAGYLEDGTSKMEKRPYLKPSIEEAEPFINHYFEDALKRILKI